MTHWTIALIMIFLKFWITYFLLTYKATKFALCQLTKKWAMLTDFKNLIFLVFDLNVLDGGVAVILSGVPIE